MAIAVAIAIVMDYKEEQKNEVEALESIYYEEFSLLSEDPYSFTISVKSDDTETICDNGEVLEGLSCLLKITYTPTYPESLPEVEVTEAENLTDSDIEDLLKTVLEYGQENLGIVMVFSFVSCVQEWLNTKWDRLKKNQEEEAELRIRKAEEEERKRFEGTRVTVESFLAWKHAFEEELGIYKKIAKDANRKLTGRELFMQDQTLNESDLKFLDPGAQVAVDESLFQDMDDLEIDDEDLSDDDDDE